MERRLPDHAEARTIRALAARLSPAQMFALVLRGLGYGSHHDGTRVRRAGRERGLGASPGAGFGGGATRDRRRRRLVAGWVESRHRAILVVLGAHCLADEYTHRMAESEPYRAYLAGQYSGIKFIPDKNYRQPNRF